LFPGVGKILLPGLASEQVEIFLFELGMISLILIDVFLPFSPDFEARLRVLLRTDRLKPK
jgi:hypothetical protein